MLGPCTRMSRQTNCVFLAKFMDRRVFGMFYGTVPVHRHPVVSELRAGEVTYSPCGEQEKVHARILVQI